MSKQHSLLIGLLPKLFLSITEDNKKHWIYNQNKEYRNIRKKKNFKLLIIPLPRDNHFANGSFQAFFYTLKLWVCLWCFEP